jgi:hypothetical protein
VYRICCARTGFVGFEFFLASHSGYRIHTGRPALRDRQIWGAAVPSTTGEDFLLRAIAVVVLVTLVAGTGYATSSASIGSR